MTLPPSRSARPSSWTSASSDPLAARRRVRRRARSFREATGVPRRARAVEDSEAPRVAVSLQVRLPSPPHEASRATSRRSRSRSTSRQRDLRLLASSEQPITDVFWPREELYREGQAEAAKSVRRRRGLGRERGMKLVLRQEFPLGRFHATPWRVNPFDDPHGEWPPSPWRLVRAVTARWYQWARETEQEPDVAKLEDYKPRCARALTRSISRLTRGREARSGSTTRPSSAGGQPRRRRREHVATARASSRTTTGASPRVARVVVHRRR